jgi:hypothetical protein
MRNTALIIVSLTLAACATQSEITGFGDETFSSAEMTGFEKADARFRYADAHIGYDESGCARYQGVASNGRVRSELLRDEANRPICDSRRVDAFTSRWLLDSR